MLRNAKQQTYSQSLLLSAISPFQWIFAIFIIAPPPCFTFNTATFSGKAYYLARLLYASYALILLGLTMLSAYTGTVFNSRIREELKFDGLTNILNRSIIIAIPFMQVLSQLTTLLGHRQIQRIFANIEQLEHDIRWHSHLTNATSAALSFGSAFRWQILSKAGSLLLLLFALHTSTDFLLAAGKMKLEYKLIAVFFTLLIQIKSVEFCVAVQLVEALLQQLLKELSYIRQELNAASTLAEERRMLYVALQRNRELLARIWQLVDALESYFTIPMLALFLYNALTIVYTVNWAYYHQKLHGSQVITDNYYRLIFICLILTNMLVPCWLCQTCIQIYGQFAIELHNLRSNGADMRLSCCLREYSLQLMHQKLLFTCGGLFDINLQHFGSRVLTITTYVVILIQFKMQAEAEKAYEEKMN